MNVADLMTRDVVWVSPQHSVRHAAALMIERGISGLPVLDDSGTVVGMITEGDLLRRIDRSMADETETLWHRLAAPEGAARDFVKTHSWRVGDVMTAPVVFVTEATSLHRVAELLESRMVRRLPVLRDGRLVGVVSRGDLLKCIVAEMPASAIVGDEAITVSVRARLRDAEKLLGKTPEVTVERGVVHLWGSLDSQSERDVARVVVESIPGIEGIEDHTTLS